MRRSEATVGQKGFSQPHFPKRTRISFSQFSSYMAVPWLSCLKLMNLAVANPSPSVACQSPLLSYPTLICRLSSPNYLYTRRHLVHTSSFQLRYISCREDVRAPPPRLVATESRGTDDRASGFPNDTPKRSSRPASPATVAVTRQNGLPTA